MKKVFYFFSLLSFLLLSCQDQEPEPLNIAVAANMQFAIKEIAQSFTEKTGTEVQLMISSSGKLNAQIKEGAPYDVFVSADMKYPQDLFEAGLAMEAPQIYAYGKLVLWSNMDGLEASINALEDSNIKHIALPNPKIAPYGAAAMEWIQHHGLEEVIQEKLVYGESISQCTQFILSKSAEIGFCSKSVVLSPQIEHLGSWIDLDTSLYSPIIQGMIVIKHRNSNRNSKNAMDFSKFLLSKEAQHILIKFGYSIKNQ